MAQHSLAAIRTNRLVQSHIGFSKENELVIVRPFNFDKQLAPEGTHRYTCEAFIFKLPDELLNEIFTLAIRSDAESFGKGQYASALTLSVICKRFSRIAQPLLYYNIFAGKSYGSTLVPPKRSVKLLYRTLKAYPALGKLCKRLYLGIDDVRRPGPNDFVLANDLLPWLTNVRSLNIHGGFESMETWPTIRNALAHMPYIDDLTISREGCGLRLIDICRYVNLPHLCNLYLHGIGNPRIPQQALVSSSAKVRLHRCAFLLGLTRDLQLPKDLEKSRHVYHLLGPSISLYIC